MPLVFRGYLPAQGTTPGNPLQSVDMFFELEIAAIQARLMQLNELTGQDLIAFQPRARAAA